jgi:hypothetical protein
LKVWPALDEELNLERFLKEKHDLALVLFDQAYDINGNFQDSLYMAAYQRYLDAQIVRLSNVGSTVMIGQNTSSRNTSIRSTHPRVSQTGGRGTGRNSARNVVTVTTPIGRLMRPMIDQLMSMETFSWAYVPFLKAVFTPGDFNLSHASLMILDMFWPKESNIYSSLEDISHAYEQIGNDIQCNLREEIYNKYAVQRYWYPPAEDQEVMLANIQRYRAYRTTNQININHPISRLFDYFDNDFNTPAAITIDNCMTNLTTAIINMQQNRNQGVALPPLPPRYSETEGIKLLRNYKNVLQNTRQTVLPCQQSSSRQSTLVIERGTIHIYICIYCISLTYIHRFLINRTQLILPI